MSGRGVGGEGWAGLGRQGRAEVALVVGLRPGGCGEGRARAAAACAAAWVGLPRGRSSGAAAVLVECPGAQLPFASRCQGAG